MQQLERQANALLRLAAWVALLFFGYGLQRWLCSFGLPYDCDATSAADVFSALTLLALAGSAAGWLAGTSTAARFAWLTAPRQAYIWLTYLAVLPAYSALSNAPALRASLSTVNSWGLGMAAVAALGAAAAAAALAWHMWHAFQAGVHACEPSRSAGPTAAAAAAAAAATAAAEVCPAGPAAEDSAADQGRAMSSGPLQPSHLPDTGSSPTLEADTERGLLLLPSTGTVSSSSSSSCRRARWRRHRAGWRALALFLLPLLPPLAFFAAWAAALPASGAFSLHLHHYALGWGLATFGAFNHPISGLTLAVGAAIFVQGAAAYGFDPFFSARRPPQPGGCLPASSDSGQMTCAFWSAQPFSLRFCSDTPWIPWFDCSLPWPDTAVRGAHASMPTIGSPAPTVAAPPVQLAAAPGPEG
ncbi:hypothetical protein ABPG75_003294 [Micractinium tetrahymenae]